MRVVEFSVLGVAQPKGSARAFIPKGWKHPIVTSTNRNLKAWESLIATAAQDAARGIFFDGPIALELRFRLPRPKSLPARVTHHQTKPDLDKCIRALDALTGILWRDDAQVVAISAVKGYAPAGAPASLTVRVSAITVAQIEPLPLPLFEAAAG
ncbi:MAG TPA: RusA family crossover junction endodeoxyribonuclease [Gemmatimonadales bacterium]|jgi:crossover junction endodeoxyribonuclease RusA|nr:RusA family crossover junction endodeoxyribonuclease [Gemmatimonadales bacterium]